MTTILQRQISEPRIDTLGTIFGTMDLTRVVRPAAIQNDNINVSNTVHTQLRALDMNQPFRPSWLERLQIAQNKAPETREIRAHKVGLPPTNISNAWTFNYRDIPNAQIVEEHTEPNLLYLGTASWKGTKQFPNRSSNRIAVDRPILDRYSKLRSQRLY